MRNYGFSRVGITVLAVSLLILPVAASANDYYVSPTGSDTNSGSQTSPWKTIAHADSAFTLGSDGTAIHVAAGIYAGGILITRGGSSPSVRLVIQCDPGAASAMIAMGQCRITGGPWGVLVQANNVDIVGFDVGGSPNMSFGISGACQFQDGSALCNTANSMHVIGNYIHDLGQNVANAVGIMGCPQNGALGVGSNHKGYTATDPQASRNFVVNFGINPAPAGCNTAQGIYFGDVPAGDRAIIQNNLVIKVPVSGITDSYSICSFVLTNNTLIGSRFGIALSGSGSGCPNSAAGNITIANNAIFNMTTSSIWYVNTTDCSSGHPTLYSNNISDGTKPDYSGFGNYTNPQACDSVTPNPWIHLSPASFFVNYQPDGSGDYHLRSSAAAIAVGSTNCVPGGVSPCTPSADFDGILRPPLLSVGAFEARPYIAPPSVIRAQVR